MCEYICFLSTWKYCLKTNYRNQTVQARQAIEVC